MRKDVVSDDSDEKKTLNESEMMFLDKRVVNVHSDDIHGICVWDKYIISGSKDTSVRMFNKDGEFIESVWKPKNTKGTSSYQCWVTALDVFPDGSVLGGYRNGYVFLKNLENNKVFYNGFLGKMLENSSIKKNCKQRNEYRITSAKVLEGNDDFTAMLGFPGKFCKFNFLDNELVGTYCFKQPDWVYGFSELKSSEALAVINAASLSIFKEADGRWSRNLLLKEGKPLVNGRRPFISDVNVMGSEVNNSSLLALAFFGGATRVIDAETSKVVHKGNEHSGRVWQALPFAESNYISCADDKKIKIWDIRERRSVSTGSEHPGRVSSLAFISMFRFVAGSCPDDPHADEDQGQFFFYDLRMG